MPTVSIVKGHGYSKHNDRSIKNIDPKNRSWNPELSNQNIIIVNENIKSKYHELFDEALEKYNAKQTQSTRKIKDYYEKISRSKQEKTFYELIVSIGDMESIPKGSDIEKQSIKALTDYAKNFSKRNKSLAVFQNIIHLDEKGVPHVHIDFIPVSKENKRGLETKNSLGGALKDMGFGRNGFEAWRENELEVMISDMHYHGLEYEVGTGRTEHFKKTSDYKKYIEQRQEATETIQKLSSKITDLKKDYEQFDNDLKTIKSKKIEIEDLNIPQKKLLGNHVMVDSDNLNQILEQNKTYILHREELEQLPTLHKQLDERLFDVTRMEIQSKRKIEQAEQELAKKVKKTESELDEKVQKTNLSLEKKEKDYAARSNELDNSKREFETEKFIKQTQIEHKLREYNEKSLAADEKMAEADHKIANAETIAEKNIKQKYENQIRTQQNEIQKLNEQLEYQKSYYETEVCQATNNAFQVGFEQAVNDYTEQLNQLKNDNKVLNNQLETQKNENKIINSELNTTKNDLLNANARIENSVNVFKKQEKKLHDLQNEKEKLSADFKKQLLEKDNVIQDLKNKLQTAFVKIKDIAKSISSLYYDDDFKQNLNTRGKFVLEAIDRNVTRFLENHGKHDLAEIVRTKTGLSEDIENDFLKIRKEHNRNQGISR